MLCMRALGRLVRYVLDTASWILLECQSAVAYRLWGIEGVDRLLPRCSASNLAHLLRRFGAAVGSNSDLQCGLIIHNARRDYANLVIGDHCHLGRDVLLDLRDAIRVEDCVTISMRAMILTHTDVGCSPLKNKAFPASQSPVLIKQGAYIGAGVIIVQGVTLGECAVVGCGAVVAEDIPAYSVAVGVPAKVIRSIGVE
jgi:acetyltransferase-like isoleucine patch superfamily enzyme